MDNTIRAKFGFSPGVAEPLIVNPSGIAALPSILLLCNTGLGPMPNAFFQALILHINALIESGKLRNAETVYDENYGSTTTHDANGAPQASASRVQGSDLTKINQLAYSGNLGAGASTLRGSGCMLASLTMTANDMRRASGNNDLIDLPRANGLVLDSGGFSGSDMRFNDAAHALGVNVVSRQAANDAAMQTAIVEMQTHPKTTRLIVGVDYKTGSNSAVSQADHYIAVKGIDDDGNLLATDPAGGKDITFTRGFDGKYRSGKYTIAEVSVITPDQKLQPKPVIAAR